MGRNALFFWLVLICSLHTCSEQNTGYLIPQHRVNASAAGWSSQNGQTYWQGQVFSGYRYALYPSADTAECIPFWQGREEGMARYWHPNGQLREQRWFKGGKRTGTHYGWWENGQRSFEYPFSADLHEGMAYTWHRNGRLATAFQYQQGQEMGAQIAWYPNGKLRLNYVVRNGRQYGLTGVKNCATVWDANLREFVEKPE